MQRRTELDGLRAWAVALVVGAHAHLPGFAGGWVGVDVFFVLSGYLITSIVLTEQAQGRFSYTDFFQRRARRLLPALVATALLSFCIAFFLFPPALFDQARTTLLWSILGFGNIEQAQNADYFADDGALNPYGHLWSLGVEEQFYLVFPFLFAFLWRTQRLLLGLYALLAISLGAMFALGHQPSSYFFPWTRGWTLIVGAVLAVHHQQTAKRAHPAWGAMGLGALVLATWMGNEDGTLWPVFSLWAALATALVLAAKPTYTRRVLTHPALLAVGTASYSIYLVHQPILVFSTIPTGGYPLGWMGTTAALGVILVAGLAMRTWVEMPFLGRGRAWPWRRTLLLQAAATVCIVVGGSQGMEALRQTASTARGGTDITQQMLPNRGMADACTEKQDLCRTQGTGVYLWGDSHAMHLAQALVANGFNPQQWTMSACPPNTGFAIYTDKGYMDRAWATQCAAFNARAFTWIRNRPQPGVLVVASAGWGIDREAVQAVDQDGKNVPFGTREERLANSLDPILEELRPKGWTILVVGPNIKWPHDPGRCATIVLWNGWTPERCTFPLNAPTQESVLHLGVETLLHTYTAAQHLGYINLTDLVCPNGLCRTVQDGVPVWRDIGHLSKAGSDWVGQQEAWKSVFSGVGTGTTRAGSTTNLNLWPGHGPW
jgi:peptidoglycan/LPS O-acetylase OafA/YrhL